MWIVSGQATEPALAPQRDGHEGRVNGRFRELRQDGANCRDGRVKQVGGGSRGRGAAVAAVVR